MRRGDPPLRMCRVYVRTWTPFIFLPFVLILFIFNLNYIENSIPNQIGIYFKSLYNYNSDLQRKKGLGCIYLKSRLYHIVII